MNHKPSIKKRGGQIQVKHDSGSGQSNQPLDVQDLSKEVPEIDETLAHIVRVLNGYTEQTRSSCGCGG
jgi:hypothetical protein